MDENDLLHDLTLMLLYLTSKDKKVAGRTLSRASKTYDGTVLDKLCREGFIDTTPASKTADLTQEGTNVAEMLVKVYGSLVGDFQHELSERLMDALPRTNEPAFRFRVELDLGGRPCWREIVVPQDFTFADLHDVIQASFLWWDYHLYDFHLTNNRKKLMLADPSSGGVDSMFDTGRAFEDATLTYLDDIFPRTRTAIYSYGYGDGWEHKVKLVETIKSYPGEMPACTAGAGDAPPEDVGGPGGFDRLLVTLAGPKGRERDEALVWAKSQGFEHFNLDRVNDRIRKWRTGELLAEWDELHPDELDGYDPFIDLPPSGDMEGGSNSGKRKGLGSGNLRLVP